MITVGPVGSFLMKISPEFSKYAEQELGLKDPFAAKKYCLKEGVDLTKVQPCKGVDGQCNMDCIYFQGGCRK